MGCTAKPWDFLERGGDRLGRGCIFGDNCVDLFPNECIDAVLADDGIEKRLDTVEVVIVRNDRNCEFR